MRFRLGLWLPVVVVLCLPAPVTAQDESAARFQLARTLLQLSGGPGASATAAEALTPLRSRLPDMPPAVWDSVDAYLDRLMPAFTDSLARIYAEQLSADDLRGLIAFYESPLGQRYLALQPLVVRRMADMAAATGSQVRVRQRP